MRQHRPFLLTLLLVLLLTTAGLPALAGPSPTDGWIDAFRIHLAAWFGPPGPAGPSSLPIPADTDDDNTFPNLDPDGLTTTDPADPDNTFPNLDPNGLTAPTDPADPDNTYPDLDPDG